MSNQSSESPIRFAPSLQSEIAPRLKTLEHYQPEATEQIARAVARVRNAPPRPDGRPRASFLFLGPTGVGKSLAAQSLALPLCEDHASVQRVDRFICRLAHHEFIGNSVPLPGLADRLYRLQETRGVLLIEEVEKFPAAFLQDVLPSLLTGRASAALGEGGLSDVYVACTCNAGSTADDLEDLPFDRLRRHFLDAAAEVLPKEVMNGFTDAVAFRPITKKVQGQICRDAMEKTAAELIGLSSTQGKTPRFEIISPSTEVLNFVRDHARLSGMGARALRNVASHEVREAFRSLIDNGGTPQDGEQPRTLRFDVVGKKLILEPAVA